MECAKEGTSYWESLKKCQPEDLVAYANFEDGDTNLYTKTATIPFNTTDKTYDISSISSAERTISAVGSCPTGVLNMATIISVARSQKFWCNA